MASSGITLVIKSMVGQTYKIQCEGNENIGDVMSKIEEQSEISAARQKLITLRKQPMDPAKTVADYGLKNNSKVFLIVLAGNFREVLEPRGSFVFIANYTDGSTTLGTSFNMPIWLNVTFNEAGTPSEFIREYQPPCDWGQRQINWNTELLAFQKGSPLGLHEDHPLPLTQENVFTCRFWHRDNKCIWTFVFYHEDPATINQWSDCFGNMDVQNNMERTMEDLQKESEEDH